MNVVKTLAKSLTVSQIDNDCILECESQVRASTLRTGTSISKTSNILISYCYTLKFCCFLFCEQIKYHLKYLEDNTSIRYIHIASREAGTRKGPGEGGGGKRLLVGTIKILTKILTR